MDNPPENEALEKYLDRLCSLFVVMPETEQAEVRDEIRQHLLTMIALHEAEGLSTPEAVEVTLEKFGDPHKIGADMLKAWRKKRDATLTNERPKNARLPASVIHLYQMGCGIGLGWTLFSNVSRPHFSWAAVVISAVTWGSVFGLMEAAKTEPSQRPRDISVEPGRRWGAKNTKQALEKYWAQQLGQKPSRHEVGKLVTQLAVRSIILADFIWRFGSIPLVVTFFVFLISAWLAKEAARRINYKTRRVR